MLVGDLIMCWNRKGDFAFKHQCVVTGLHRLCKTRINQSFNQSTNQSINICVGPIHNKSPLVMLYKLSRSKPCSLIHLFTETHHFPSVASTWQWWEKKWMSHRPLKSQCEAQRGGSGCGHLDSAWLLSTAFLSKNGPRALPVASYTARGYSFYLRWPCP